MLGRQKKSKRQIENKEDIQMMLDTKSEQK